MHTEPFVLFALICVIAIAASTFTALFPKLRLPTAVLELLLGISLGKSGLHALPIPSWFHDASSLGLLYLMFLAGLEIRPSKRGNNETARISYLLIFRSLRRPQRSRFWQGVCLFILDGHPIHCLARLSLRRHPLASWYPSFTNADSLRHALGN
ncbi:hypothetical protein ATW55_12995 [Ferroacidibacillus organovorans]|uniref:Cation/H+ exchanger transmembrane domain-containing protein n=1 Tax=Ferroacidibacillus organovorans TaxID=1765683 RepID=A0A101XT52_9BACL|nr:cation:proton antiporter [Ferroacidibacillus organovorans]KUO96971.1 hypothetical protein ATW55_12995 [Ferroacidibacillus organovorans]